MKKGLILFPAWYSTAVDSIPGSPPIPDPIMHPDLLLKSPSIFNMLLFSKHSLLEASENLMKSSIFFISFFSTHSSAIKDPGLSWSLGTSHAILHFKSLALKFLMWFAPEWPSVNFFQLCDTPQPNGVTMPIPVTTTLLINFK